MAIHEPGRQAGRDTRGVPHDHDNVVFLLDCDNTLLDNDALKADMNVRLCMVLGEAIAARFWAVYEQVRLDTDTVDLPMTFDRLAGDCTPEMLDRARATVMDYPFAERLYPATLPTLAHLREIGTPVILSDGDSVYQPRKIEGSGLAAAVNGQVAVYVHKEHHLDAVMARWPASFYVMVDDKLRILSTLKLLLPERFVTVHVRQGHYGMQPGDEVPVPDITVSHISELRDVTLDALKVHLGAH